jgi:hypothetical protein
MLLRARNPRAAEQRDTPSTSTRGLVRPRRRRRLRGSVGCRSVFYGASTKSARTFPTPDTADRPDQARGGSDKPLRSGPKIDRPLPIMGRTLPITVKEPTEEVGDR